MRSQRTVKLLAVSTVCGSVLALSGFASASPGAGAAKLKPGASRILKGKTEAGNVACPHGKAPSLETCYVVGTANATPANTLSVVRHGVPKSTTGESPGGSAITCPTSTVCVVGGASTSNGTVQWFTSGQPGATVNVTGTSVIESVACMSATKCLVVGYHQNATNPSGPTPQQGEFAIVTPTGTATGKRVAGTSQLDGVACRTSSSCIAVGYSGNGSVHRAKVVSIKNGHAGKAKSMSGNDELENISCGSSKVCWIAGLTESAAHGVRTTFTEVKGGKAKHPIVAPTAGTALACVSATTCYGSGLGVSQSGPGKLIRIVKGHVKASVVIKKTVLVSGVSCPAPTSCIVAGPSSFHNSGQPNFFWRSAVAIVKV